MEGALGLELQQGTTEGTLDILLSSPSPCPVKGRTEARDVSFSVKVTRGSVAELGLGTSSPVPRSTAP